MYIPEDFKKVNNFQHVVCVKPRDLYARFGGCATPNGSFSGSIEDCETLSLSTRKMDQLREISALDEQYSRTEAYNKHLEEVERARQEQSVEHE